MHTESGRLHAAVLITAAFLSIMLAGKALWIPTKAVLAQRLLQLSWQQVLAGQVQVRPWPWADTRPTAVLKAPRFGLEQIVLEGNSGRNLAFGPVLADASRNGRDRVISGHRDTHFQFLEFLQPGDLIQLQTVKGIVAYRVQDFEVIDSRTEELVIEPSIDRLSLVTCYPFDAGSAGSPLRYVVTAMPVATETFSPGRPAVSSG